MGEVKWIKLCTALPDNRKMRMIRSMPDGNAIALFWVYLLCLAGQTNDGGCVYFTRDIPYTDEMLATQFDFDVPLVRMALQTFQRFGMIDVTDSIIHVSSWERYQAADKLEEIRAQTRKRVAAYAERKKLAAANVSANVSLTLANATDKEEDIEEDKNKSNKERKTFHAPTVTDVEQYCTESGNEIDAQAFIDFYSSKGWRVGNTPMKDWKAAVRNWKRRDNERGQTARKGMGANAGYKQTMLSDAELDALLLDLDAVDL